MCVTVGWVSGLITCFKRDVIGSPRFCWHILGAPVGGGLSSVLWAFFVLLSFSLIVPVSHLCQYWTDPLSRFTCLYFCNPIMIFYGQMYEKQVQASTFRPR